MKVRKKKRETVRGYVRHRQRKKKRKKVREYERGKVESR